MLSREEYERYEHGLIQEGRAKALLSILDARGIRVTAVQRDYILGRRDSVLLDGFVRRAVSATSTDEVLGWDVNEDEKEWMIATHDVVKLAKRELIQKGKARVLLAILDARGLGVTEEQRKLISGRQEPGRLARFLRRAVSAASTDEVLG